MTNLRHPSKEHRCTYLKIPVSLLVKYILLFQAAFQTLVGCRGQSARPDHWGQMFPERAGDEATTMIRERKMHYSSIVIFVPLALQLCSQLLETSGKQSRLVLIPPARHMYVDR